MRRFENAGSNSTRCHDLSAVPPSTGCHSRDLLIREEEGRKGSEVIKLANGSL